MGFLDGYPGLGAGGNIDLNQLVRPPDPLGAALGEISQRLAVAGQASRLPTSTLGAIGSALGGASTAAQAQQTQYLDQAIKLQALRRALQQAGIDERLAPLYYQIAQRALTQGAAPGGAAPGVPSVPGAPQAAPGAPAAVPAPAVPGAGGPAATPPAAGPYGSDAYYGEPSVQPPAYVPGAAAPPTGLGRGDQGSAARAQLTSLSGNPYGGLLAADLGGTIDPNTGGDLWIPNPGGGPAAGVTQTNFRPASLVGPAGAGDGSGAGSDPLGLIAKYESGGRNIRQQVVPESVSSASGPWQMLDSTFHETAKKAGIDTSKYDSAKDAPIDVQRQVAQALYNEKGFAPWANYNPKLAAAIGGGTATGGTASPVSALRGLLAGSDSGGGGDPLAGLLALASGGTSGNGGEDPLAGLLKPQDEVIPSGGGLPAGLLQKTALGAGNAGYPIANILPPGGNAAFPALPPNTTNNGQQGDVVLPSGAPLVPTRDEIPPGAVVGDAPRMQLAQYAPGGGAPAAGGGAAPAGADLATIMQGMLQQRAPSSTGGVIPGLGITPQAVAALNALSTLAGHTTPPLKEFLDLYYKDPAYLQDAARAGQLGKSQVDLQFAPMIAGLTALAQAPGLKLQAEDKAAIDRVTDIIKQQTTASLEPTTMIVKGPNGPVEQPMTRLDKANIEMGKPPPGYLGMGAVTPLSTPYFTDAEKKQNDAALADYTTNVAAPFQAGQKALVPLTQIETAMQNFTTGPGAETELAVKKALQSFANNVPIVPNSLLADPKQIASGEIIRKSGNALGFELARSLGAHEAENVVNQAIQSNPGLSVSPQGNMTLIGLIKQGIQRDFDKNKFYNDWFAGRVPGARGGTYVGADDAFNESHPVASYVNRVLPSQATPPKMKYNPQTQQLEPL